MNNSQAKHANKASPVPRLGTDSNGNNPYVEIEGQVYRTLEGLIAACPDLVVPDNLRAYCKFILHFHPGPQCVLIDNVNQFRHQYQVLVEAEKNAIAAPRKATKIERPNAAQKTPPKAAAPSNAGQLKGGGAALLRKALLKSAPPLASVAAKRTQKTGQLYSHPIPDDTTLTDLGLFDLSEIDLPRIEQGMLIFYAEQVKYHMPYKVMIPFPAPNEGQVRFSLLPSL